MHAHANFGLLYRYYRNIVLVLPFNKEICVEQANFGILYRYYRITILTMNCIKPRSQSRGLNGRKILFLTTTGMKRKKRSTNGRGGGFDDSVPGDVVIYLDRVIMNYKIRPWLSTKSIIVYALSM